MAIPFKTKQVFRELFEFVSSNGKLSADDLRGTNKMFYPPFTDGIVAKHAESCPLTVDGFLGFIAEARQETNAPWDDIVWGYAQNFAKRFVFNNSPQMEMKQLRAVIDPSVRPVKPEPELSALWKTHCGTGQANVAGLVALLKSLVQGGQMQLGAALQAMLPKGKKNAAGLHPAAAGPSSPRRATVTASSPTSPASPKKETTVPPPPPPRPAASSPKAEEKPKTPVAAEPPKAPESSAPEEPASPASLEATARDPVAPAAAAAPAATEASPKSPTPPRAMSPNADRAPSPSAFGGAPSPRHSATDLELNASLLAGANPSFAALRSATSGIQQPSAQPPQAGGGQRTKPQQPPPADKSTVGVTCRLEAEPLPRAVVEVVREIDTQRETLHKLLEEELAELQASTTVVDSLKQRLEALKARKGAAATAADEQKRLEAKMDKFARDVASQQQFLHASISTTLRQQAVDAEHARLAIEMQAATPYHHGAPGSSGAYGYGGADVSAASSGSAVGTFAGTSAVRLQQLNESVRVREQQLQEKEAALRKMRKIEREEQRLLSELTAREQQQHQMLLQQQQEQQQPQNQHPRQHQSAPGPSETPLMARRAAAGSSQMHVDPRYALQPSSVGARDGYVMPPKFGATPAAQAAARGSTGTRSHTGDGSASMTTPASNPYAGGKLTRDSASNYLSHRR